MKSKTVRDAIVLLAFTAAVGMISYYVRNGCQSAGFESRADGVPSKAPTAEDAETGHVVQGHAGVFARWLSEEKKTAKIEKVVDYAGKEAIAYVNGIPLKTVDFQSRLELRKKMMKGAGHASVNEENAAASGIRLKKKLLDQLIDEEIIRQEAEKRGIAVTNRETNRILNKKEKDFGTKDGYSAMLRRYGVTEQQLRNDIRNDLLKQKLVEAILIEMSGE